MEQKHDWRWWTETSEGAERATIYLLEHELATALQKFGFVRLDLPPDYRVVLRWDGAGLGRGRLPYSGQVWKNTNLVAEDGAMLLAFLLVQLRAACARLIPPVQW